MQVGGEILMKLGIELIFLSGYSLQKAFSNDSRVGKKRFMAAFDLDEIKLAETMGHTQIGAWR